MFRVNDTISHKDWTHTYKVVKVGIACYMLKNTIYPREKVKLFKIKWVDSKCQLAYRKV